MFKKINIFDLIKKAKKNKPIKSRIVNMWQPTITITKKGENNANNTRGYSYK
tara:strand:+ start:373 stop:528 length:156 start_codon:yes stop_codon:yes gene_type:complete